MKPKTVQEFIEYYDELISVLFIHLVEDNSCYMYECEDIDYVDYDILGCEVHEYKEKKNKYGYTVDLYISKGENNDF